MNARAWARWWRVVGRPAVVRLLWTEWDPIGIRDVDGAADEYDCVADPVCAKLRQGASAAEVAALLGSSATGHFGLGPDPDADAHAADLLLAWYAAAIDEQRFG
jgi:hypothetical protein